MKQTAYITQINSLSSHDGPGARTTIFLKGCSLRCEWCHNPETCEFKQEVVWHRAKCIGCGKCMETCQQGALMLSDKTKFIDRDLCVRCGKCVSVCPAKALEFVAKHYSTDEISSLIVKNRPLFTAMNGGVTFSGGEPAMQSKFISEVIDSLKEQKIHYALDSCGQAPFSSYELLLPKIDLLLFDVKEMDSQKHKEFTGETNKLILENLSKIIAYIKENDLRCKIWIRTPLIPKYTATLENVEAIAKLLVSLPSGVIERWDMCTFNNLCNHKYNELGLDWSLNGEELLNSEQSKQFLATAKEIVSNNFTVNISGLTSRGK